MAPPCAPAEDLYDCGCVNGRPSGPPPSSSPPANRGCLDFRGPIALNSVEEMMRFWIWFRCEYVRGFRALACECDNTSTRQKATTKPAHASGTTTRRLADI